MLYVVWILYMDLETCTMPKILSCVQAAIITLQLFANSLSELLIFVTE